MTVLEVPAGETTREKTWTGRVPDRDEKVPGARGTGAICGWLERVLSNSELLCGLQGSFFFIRNVEFCQRLPNQRGNERASSSL